MLKRLAIFLHGSDSCLRYVPLPVSVKYTLLLRKPMSCNPAAETAHQPLIWCSES